MSHLHHKVSALVDGELSPAARSRALAHAQHCAPCRQEIAETLEVKRRLHKLASVELSDDLHAVVTCAAPYRSAGPEPDRSPLLQKVIVSVGSLSAVVIVLAYVVGAPVPTHARPVTPSVEEFAADFAGTTGLSPLSDPVGAVGSMSTDSGATSPVGLGDDEGAWNAQSTAHASERSNDDALALRLLRKAMLAPQLIAYQGLRVVRTLTSQGVDSSVLKVTHVPGQGTRFDASVSGSTGTSEWFVSDADAAADGAGGPETLDQLASSYDLHMDGTDEVDGRPTQVVSASQDGEVCARFWIDEATGLLLRKEMYVDGQLVRWSGYTTLSTTRRAFLEHLPPEMQTAPTTKLSRAIAPALNDKGWTCPEWLTSDFRLLGLQQMDAGGAVMRAEYSDGMSTVSVFEQHGALDTSALTGFRTDQIDGRVVYLRDGLPMTAVWQSGDRVLTIVTDAPEQVATRVLRRLPDDAAESPTGLVPRVRTGLSRMASAVSP